MIIPSTPESEARFKAAEAAAKLRERQDYQRKWQQIMDRLNGRVMCYENEAHKAKGGPKLYTRTQVEGIRAKAMVEARLIVWMFKEDDDTLASESDCAADETADETSGRSAYNAPV